MSATVDLSNPEKRLVRGLQTISDETRFKMFKLMMSGEELCVSSIAERLNVSVSAVSQHFRLFEQAGFVNKQRYAQKVCYRLKESDALVEKLIMLAGNR